MLRGAGDKLVAASGSPSAATMGGMTARGPARRRAVALGDLVSEQQSVPDSSATPRKLEISWEALEDAFENNAPEVHSYLNLLTGEVLRVVDGVADPAMHQRIASDSSYQRVDPVSSREQYRWMERFIPTVVEGELRSRLVAAIDGKGAFRRFKDVLMGYPVERERWFEFRTERLRACMDAWLIAHRIEAVARPVWTTGQTSEPGAPSQEPEPIAAPLRRDRVGGDGIRQRVRELVEVVPAAELSTALAFLEWLRDRRSGSALTPSDGSVDRDEDSSEP
jgi:hypothetical protein